MQEISFERTNSCETRLWTWSLWPGWETLAYWLLNLAPLICWINLEYLKTNLMNFRKVNP